MEAETAVVHASVGWSVNISCIVWSNPPATVSWYRGQASMDLLQTQTQPQQMVSVRFRDIIQYRDVFFPQFLQNYCTTNNTSLSLPPLQASDGSSVFSLTILPELEHHITNYTCKAQNTLGQNRATVLLTGCHLQSPEC